MKNSPIIKFKPELIHLRIYLYQLINDNFGLSEDIRHTLIETFGGDSTEIIDELTFEDLDLLLTWEYIPDNLFVFKDENGEPPILITQIPSDHSLRILINKCNEKHIELPKLYTGINQVSFENDGLLVMINYNTQIDSCCTSSGKDLLGYCHDCDLGYNGLILSRGSSQLYYEIYQWDGSQLEQLGSFWPSERPDVFPHLGTRDIISEMLLEQEHLIDYYPEVEYKTEVDIYQLFTNVSGSFRVLVNEYSNNQELALAAVQSNILAFTFLSEDLRRDISFIKRLFEHLSEPFELYNYLDEDIRKDREIISYVYRKYPRSLEHLDIIEDGQMIVNLFNDGFYDAGKYINLLSDTLKNDHEFLLNLAKINWRKMLEHSPELYTNKDFIEKLIIVVDEYLENKIRQSKVKKNKPSFENQDQKKNNALARGIRNQLLLQISQMPIHKNFEEEVYAYILALPESIKLLEQNKDLLNKLSLEFIISNIPWGQMSTVLKLMGLIPISASTAESLAKHKGNLDLSGLTSLFVAAAEALSRHEGNLYLNGLTTLSDGAAESLSKHKGSLHLSGLTSLSDIAAESLAKHNGDLHLNGLTSLSDAAAESLSRHQGPIELNDLKTLSDFGLVTFARHKLEISLSDFLSKKLNSFVAEQFLINQDEIELSEYTSITDTAAEVLSGHNGWLILDGLTFLSDAAAKSLAKHKSILDLRGLTSLSEVAAKFLAKHKDTLDLSGLTSLSDSTAEFLSKHQGRLELNGLKSISDNVVQALSKHKSMLVLNGLTYLSDTAAETLVKHKGALVLNGLKFLTDIAAEAFSRHQGGLVLNGLTFLSDAAAQTLGRYKGKDLVLDGLTSLSDAAAEALGRYRGHNLKLSGLKSLNDAAAESLSKHKGRLDLSSLVFLSDVAAEAFSRHRGGLVLNGLTFLSDAAAESLSKHKGRLDLSSLVFLSDVAAEAFSRHRGGLVLNGLTFLSDAAAEPLSNHKGSLGLCSLASLTNAAAESLSKHEGDLYLNELKTLSDAAAMSLAKHKVGDLYLNGLKTLTDAAAESLSKHQGRLELKKTKKLF